MLRTPQRTFLEGDGAVQRKDLGGSREVGDHPEGGMTAIPESCVLLNSLVLKGEPTENPPLPKTPNQEPSESNYWAQLDK